MTTTASAPAQSAPPGIPAPELLPSGEFGLAIGFILGRFAINMQDLHYGYWTEGLPVLAPNLPQAQAQYTEHLFTRIPDGVRSILDVGCGAGTTARKLLDKGYQVDCVSPNGPLSGFVRQQIGNRATLFETKFEDIVTDRRYDLLLFSESLLFMNLDLALARAAELLNPGGYVLICDIFRVPAEGKSPIGGGHQLPAFRATVAKFPFQLVSDTDITDRIAPTFDLLDDAYAQAIKPVYDLVLARLSAKRPWLMGFLKWKFRKQMQRYEAKHFSGRRNGENFKRYKSYRQILFRKT
ncbi:MAG TPA: methyltransferase domain-containing protein [Gemmatimonadales bacterium]|nr:methyltransferase domain-containing protein [Gemmatimonadales bacterium]